MDLYLCNYHKAIKRQATDNYDCIPKILNVNNNIKTSDQDACRILTYEVKIQDGGGRPISWLSCIVCVS